MGSQVKKMMVTTETVEQVLSSPVRFMYNLAEETCWKRREVTDMQSFGSINSAQDRLVRNVKLHLINKFEYFLSSRRLLD